MTDDIRERIDELVEAFVLKLDKSGVPFAVCDRLRDPLRDRLGDEGFRAFVLAHMADPPSRTLDGLVLAYDPSLELVELTYKN